MSGLRESGGLHGGGGLYERAGLHAAAGLYTPGGESVVAPTPLWSMDPATVYDAAGNPADPGNPVSRVDNPRVEGNDTSDLVQTTALLQPTALPLVGGEGYLYLPGVSGNYASVPDEAALDITGDLDLRVRLNGIDSPGSNSELMEKNFATSWNFRARAGGDLQLFRAGSGIISTASISYPFTGWLRATHRVLDDRVQFFTSSDGVNWTQLGADVTMPTNTPATDTSPLHIGADRAGNNPVLSALLQAQVLDGIDGTTVLDINFRDSSIAHGATSFTCDTGQTITINQSVDVPAQIVRRNVVAFDTSVNDERLEFTWPEPTGNYWICAANDAGTVTEEKSLTNGNVYEISGDATLKTSGWLSGNLIFAEIHPATISAAEKTLVEAKVAAL